MIQWKFNIHKLFTYIIVLCYNGQVHDITDFTSDVPLQISHFKGVYATWPNRWKRNASLPH